jgi:hypothetical protein
LKGGQPPSRLHTPLLAQNICHENNLVDNNIFKGAQSSSAGRLTTTTCTAGTERESDRIDLWMDARVSPTKKM